MFGKGVQLFRVFGFSVKADWSWLIIAVLITWSLASNLFPHYYPNLSGATYLWMGVLGAAGLFGSIVLHEVSHALAARQFGVQMRGITLFVFGGVAEMRDEPPNPLAEFVIAIAGPIMSLVIGAGCLALGYGAQALSLQPLLYGVLLYLGVINLVLVAFNLVPAFPLDGGRMLRALLWQLRNDLTWATRVTSTIGSAFGFVLIGLGVLSFMAGNFVGGLWWVLIGLFLNSAAQLSYRQLLVRRALEGEPVRRFMIEDVKSVPSSATLDEFVNNFVYEHHLKMFPVTDNGHLAGCITTKQLRSFPRGEWPLHTVGELAQPCSRENTIDPDADALDALRKMSKNDHSRLVVARGDHLEGVVTLRDMLRFISTRLELEETS